MNKKYIILFITLLCITGCSSRISTSDTLVIRIKDDHLILDPAYVVDVNSGIIVSQIFAPLLSYSEDMELIPCLAESWKTENGKEYIFTLKDNIKFSNGESLNALSVKKTFDRVGSLKPPSPREWIFENIDRIDILDEKKLRITLKKPSETFLAKLTMPNAFITTDGKTGSGSYKLKEWKKDQFIILDKNEYYREPVLVDKLKFKIISEEITAKTDFQLGRIDIMEIRPVDVGKYKNDNMVKVLTSPGLNTYYIGFNLRERSLQHPKLRQGMNYALDRDIIIDRVLNGMAQPADGPVPPILLQNANNVPKYSYMQNKAVNLIKHSGIDFEEGLRLGVRSNALSIQIAEILQDYLKRAGIKTKIDIFEWSAFKNAIDSGKIDLFLMSWWADFPDAENFIYPTFYSGNTGSRGNRTYFKDQDIDDLIISALDANGQQRKDLYNRLNNRIAELAPWIFLWHSKQVYIVQKYIKDFYPHPVYSCIEYRKVKKN